MRHLTIATLLGIALLAGAVAVRADEERPEAAERQTVDRLVKQLGDDEFRLREEASRKLASLGEKARPALERALENSESPEVRWRARQLLARLEGREARPLDSEEESPAAEEPASPRERDLGGMIERLQKQMERLFEGRQGWGRPLGPWATDQRVEVPGLVLERSFTGRTTLHVERKDEQGKTKTDVFTGRSLEDILARHPELATHPNMEALQRKEAERGWPGFEEFRKRLGGLGHIEIGPGSGGMTFAMSNGVEIRQDAEGVTVKIRETDENGEQTVKSYKGESLEALKREHPELAERLEGFRLNVRISPPDFFWPGKPRERLRPLLPDAEPTDATRRGLFGVKLEPVSPVLASHLGLAQGDGALIVTVLPDTPAETIGLQRHDVIVQIDGTDVTTASAVAALREAGASAEPLELVVIRAGRRLTLSR